MNHSNFFVCMCFFIFPSIIATGNTPEPAPQPCHINSPTPLPTHARRNSAKLAVGTLQLSTLALATQRRVSIAPFNKNSI